MDAKWWKPTSFTDDEKEILVASLSPSKSEPGETQFHECALCGYLKWVSTHTGKPTDVKVELMEFLSDCPRCSEAQARSPEMYRVLVGAVNRLYRNLYRDNT